ncbi:type I-C CRISPR-associated endonuclease Cas1c [uncultured Bacteroides sp.]|uniref:type I-C CRISPR-associated endonuclease Cas1c n=1 Tax=uncultured Bacteroides sp. TaxID=162156 RepID=UPI00280B33E3|nr:type I-C CRISPR-associated endonuclease Cas1c [uncultured Bacteroides sp.]
MRKLLNTLYVTTPDAYLSKDGLNIVVSVNQAEVFRIPVLNIESIVTFGYMGVSPGLMRLCVENHVSLTFLTPQGRFISRVQGATKGNVFLRTKQYYFAGDKEFSLHLSKLFIGGKIQNYRNILRRFIRDNGSNVVVESVSMHLDLAKRRIFSANSIDELRGIEGEAASTYFSVFSQLILQQRDKFPFRKRNKRPPRDAVNAMLSFVYTLIANEMSSALESVGLDPYVGFLHVLRPGRASLAFDMMEELRAYLGDRLVLSLINRKQVTEKDFFSQGDESILMTDSCRKILISCWQSRKKELITHPYLGEKIPIGLLPYSQAMLMARYIRGEIDDYPVFLIQ